MKHRPYDILSKDFSNLSYERQVFFIAALRKDREEIQRERKTQKAQKERKQRLKTTKSERRETLTLLLKEKESLKIANEIIFQKKQESKNES